MTSPPGLQNNNNPISEPSFLTKLFATGFFTGYSPVASGTAGSALALAIYCIPGFESPMVIGIVTLAAFVLGVPAAHSMEKRFGHDPSRVVIDEVVGMWIALFLLPKTIIIALGVFFLFRFFDIVKPFPARRFDTIHGGIAIMMDDVVAAMYTNIIVHLLILVM
jgi:phosphatidylglycerophosphatase A